jgi:hypothetical protein
LRVPPDGATSVDRGRASRMRSARASDTTLMPSTQSFEASRSDLPIIDDTEARRRSVRR